MFKVKGQFSHGFAIISDINWFVWSFSIHPRIFHSFGDVTITDEGLQILIYARHSSPFSIECSLTYQTHCDTGQPFIMIISEDPWHSIIWVNNSLVGRKPLNKQTFSLVFEHASFKSSYKMHAIHGITSRSLVIFTLWRNQFNSDNCTAQNVIESL